MEFFIPIRGKSALFSIKTEFFFVMRVQDSVAGLFFSFFFNQLIVY